MKNFSSDTTANTDTPKPVSSDTDKPKSTDTDTKTSVTSDTDSKKSTDTSTDTSTDAQTTTSDNDSETDTPAQTDPCANGHKYKLDGFVWTDDNTSAKAKFVCENNADHTTDVDAVIESKKLPTSTKTA